MKLDISNHQAIKDSAEQCTKVFGDVDILINNAGIVQGKEFMSLNEKLVSKQFIVNMESHFWITKEFLGPMLKNNSGQLVSIASMAGLLGQANLTDYCAAKFGAVGFMESLRVELKKNNSNVVCTTICPYFINTGMFDGATTGLLFPILEQQPTIDRMVKAIL